MKRRFIYMLICFILLFSAVRAVQVEGKSEAVSVPIIITACLIVVQVIGYCLRRNLRWICNILSIITTIQFLYPN